MWAHSAAGKEGGMVRTVRACHHTPNHSHIPPVLRHLAGHAAQPQVHSAVYGPELGIQAPVRPCMFLSTTHVGRIKNTHTYFSLPRASTSPFLNTRRVLPVSNDRSTTTVPGSMQPARECKVNEVWSETKTSWMTKEVRGCEGGVERR